MANDLTPPSPRPAGRDPRKVASDPIALGLRRLWADVEKEAVPDDFLNLLDRIDERRADLAANPQAGGSGGGGDPAI